MKKYFGIAMLAFLALSSLTSFAQKKATQLEVKDNWYYINGEKFFINAIGYEIGARPGQDPYKQPILDLGRMRFDLKVIKDAGFNAIRTWSEMSEEQLKVVQQSGLKIIFGIWVVPEKNYADPAFIKQSEDLVKKVVAYTKKYDCVISYLILNEPMTDHIYKVTGKATMGLLTDLKNIINKEHPGRPVSISANAAISDYINENFLDNYAFNCYDYHDGQGGAMGYEGFLSWVNDMNGRKKPLVITEFGYSVSDAGSGNFGYGGNTLEVQKEGVLHNYRDLIDAGATGACPFYYADGWWKGGDKNVHNNQAEEWFGFWGYADLKDTIGSPRPVWHGLEAYLNGLIISPKNQTSYGEKIPLELYLNPGVAKVIVRHKDKAIYSKQFTKSGYFADQITVDPKGIEDMELAFEFYDKNGKILKNESIYTLVSKTPVEFPKFSIEVTPGDLANSKVCTLKIKIENKEGFNVQDDLKYSFCHHIGWDSGSSAFIPVKDQLKNKEITAEQTYTIPDTCRILTVSAGVTVKYGKYTRRMHDQKIIYRGDWAKEIGHKVD